MHSTLKGFWIQEDESGSARHSPGCSARNCQSPIATRTRRNVGRPTAAVMRRTWRLRPSAITSSSHASATVLRKRTGGSRGHSGGGGSSRRASAGRGGRKGVGGGKRG